MIFLSLHHRDIVQNVLLGQNGCILSYGQTGSGKTFTMVIIIDSWLMMVDETDKIT